MSSVSLCNIARRGKLQAERRRRSVTQSAVARAVGVSRSFYNRIEAGTTACTPELAAKLATYFGGAVTELEILYPKRYPYTGEAA